MFKSILKIGKKIMKIFIKFAVSKQLKKIIKGYVINNKNVLEIAKQAVTEVAAADDITLTINRINTDNKSVLKTVIVNKNSNKVNLKFGGNHIVYDLDEKTLETQLNWVKIDNDAG